jgi:hypothetical protein
MDNIIEPNESFDFSKLNLALPISIQGGAYFTKINYQNKPLYIQTQKSLTKQGIVKTGKKIHCDLMFDNNSETLIHWFEKLETKCQQLIYDKSESWFESKLDLNDIESAFNSIIRIYKSGKYYLVRTNIKNNTVTNTPLVKIYSENENVLSIDDVTSDSNIISILEIQGIKFTNRNFQIEIELKQIMVINNETFFENCLIKIEKNKNTSISNIKDLEKEIVNEIINNNSQKENLDSEKIKLQDEENHNYDSKDENLEIEKYDVSNNINNDFINTDSYNTDSYNDDLINYNDNSNNNEIFNNDNIELDVEDLNEIDDNNLKEVELNIPLDNNLETVVLKKPNQVYYEKYKEARNKAKEAKKLAIKAYLEAKNIKKLYMLDDLDYSDNDIDNEIKEFSEIETEGL